MLSDIEDSPSWACFDRAKLHTAGWPPVRPPCAPVRIVKPTAHTGRMAGCPAAPSRPTSTPFASSPRIGGSSLSPGGCWPTGRPRWGLSQARRRAPWHVSAGVRGARWGVVAILVRRRPLRRDLTEQDGEAVWLGTPPVGLPREAIHWPRYATRSRASDASSARPAAAHRGTGGLHRIRRRPAVGTTAHHTADDLHLPELALMLVTDLAVLDHADGSVLLVANAVNWDDTDERVDDAWADAVSRLERMTAELAQPAPSTTSTYDPDAVPSFDSRTSRPDFLPRSSRRRRRSALARHSRSSSVSGSTCRRRRARSTSTASCG